MQSQPRCRLNFTPSVISSKSDLLRFTTPRLGVSQISVGLYCTGKKSVRHRRPIRTQTNCQADCEFAPSPPTLLLQGSAGFSTPKSLYPTYSPDRCQPGAELRKKTPIKPAGEVGGRRRAPGHEARHYPKARQHCYPMTFT